MGRFNTWLGLKVTRAVGTMWAAYLFAALACVSLPAVLAAHNPMILVGWIAQTFLQLVLLAILQFGQVHQGKQITTMHQQMHENEGETRVLMVRHHKVLAALLDEHRDLAQHAAERTYALHGKHEELVVVLSHILQRMDTHPQDALQSPGESAAQEPADDAT